MTQKWLFRVKKWLFGLLLGSLCRRPRKSLFSHFWATSRVGGGLHFHKTKCWKPIFPLTSAECLHQIWRHTSEQQPNLIQTPTFEPHPNLIRATLGHTPSTAGTFRKKFRKKSGKTPETLSERFLEFPSTVRLGCPKPYNSRHLRLPEHFQNCLPPSTAGGASFFRSGSGEGLSEPVMEFPAVLGVFLTHPSRIRTASEPHPNLIRTTSELTQS